MIRFDQWVTLFQKLNGGYQLNGSAAGSGGNLLSHRFLWPLNGTGGTVNLLQAFLDHLDQWLTRIKFSQRQALRRRPHAARLRSVQRAGMANAFFSSPDTAGSNTWDHLCKVGSTTGGATEPVSAIGMVGREVPWPGIRPHTARRPPATTPSRTPCPPIATTAPWGRTSRRATATTTAPLQADGLCVSRASFVRTEAEFCTAIKNHVRSRSSHARLSFGQVAWMFQSSIALGDLCDNQHLPQRHRHRLQHAGHRHRRRWRQGYVVGRRHADRGVRGSTPRTLRVGQQVRCTQTSGGAWTGIVTIATVFDHNHQRLLHRDRGRGPDHVRRYAGQRIHRSADHRREHFGRFTTRRLAMPRTRGCTTGTRQPGVESNYDRAGGGQGQAGFGTYNTMRDCYQYGKAAICTELGERGSPARRRGSTARRTRYSICCRAAAVRSTSRGSTGS